MTINHNADIAEFQRKGLELIGSLVSLSGSVFFLVEPDMQHKGVVFYGLSPSIEKEYMAEYGSLDPLHPQRFAASGETVVTLDSQMSPHFLKQTLYYQKFMVPNNHRYVADMFFRRNGQITAVISLLREAAMGDFLAQEQDMLQKLQPFLEHSLNAIYLPQRDRERQGIAEKYSLTERELDVLERLLRGRSNKQIALELNLGLATVKTHLHHIFRKTAVSARSELVSTVLRDLN